jgi:hypothetical protein
MSPAASCSTTRRPTRPAAPVTRTRRAPGPPASPRSSAAATLTPQVRGASPGRRRDPGLVGESFWRRAFDAEFLAAEGVIAPRDLQLFRYAETAEDIWSTIRDWYAADPRRALARPCP